MWSIISNNCWGANLYQELGIEYNTPTIGLWFQADDYISLISDFRNIIKQPLLFTKASRHGFTPSYPIGLLAGKVEIQFMHYESEEEAARKWTSRVARLPVSDDDLYIKICDRDGFEQRHLAVFDKIPFIHKVGFFKRGKFDLSEYPWAIEVDSPHATVEDGVTLWFQVRETGAFDVASWMKIPQDEMGKARLRYAVVFKTHFWDAFVEAQFRRLCERAGTDDVFVLVDETKGPVGGISHHAVVRLTEEISEAEGYLQYPRGNSFWYNPDYMLYHFIETFPQFDFIVVSEYDVVAKFDIYPLLQCMVDEGLDFIGKPIWGTDEGVGWKMSARPYYDETMEIKGRLCCFAIFRREFVVSLQATRREHMRKLDAGDIKFPGDGAMTWPFAEAFVGAEIVRLSVPEKSISDFVDTSNYDWWPPNHPDHVDQSSHDAIFHPVLAGERFVKSLMKYRSLMSPESWLVPNSQIRRKLDYEAPAIVVPALVEALTKQKNIGALIAVWRELKDLGWNDHQFPLVETLLNLLPTKETKNIALGKFAYQSSVSEWSRSLKPKEDAAHAVDGKITGDYGFHTNKELRPWWMVDLSAFALISEVVIFNRYPLESGRANYLSIWGSPDGRIWDCLHRRDSPEPFGGVDGSPMRAKFDVPVLARFVRIEIDGFDFLHLDEVEVFGSILESLTNIPTF